jgi:hypothetical protein
MDAVIAVHRLHHLVVGGCEGERGGGGRGVPVTGGQGQG